MTDPAPAETRDPTDRESPASAAGDVAPEAEPAGTESEGAEPESEEPGSKEPGSKEFAVLQEQIETLHREAAEAKDLARRAQADLLNVRRRADSERNTFRSRAVEDVCRSFLPVLDDLELAVAGAERTTSGAGGDGPASPNPQLEALREGVRLVQRRFTDILARQGLVAIEAEGAPFDPRLHDAVHQAPARPGQHEGEIVEVFRRGYSLDGRVIRPATVVVAAPPEDSAAAEARSGDDRNSDRAGSNGEAAAEGIADDNNANGGGAGGDSADGDRSPDSAAAGANGTDRGGSGPATEPVLS